jgi:lipoate-protein ligase A
MNPIDDFGNQDFKTMNNEVLLSALSTGFDITGTASGRNDLEVGGRKISGSAYKLKLGKKDGSGKRSLHHGTMLLDLELGALGKYLSPNKAKLESKGVDSVISRVLNLKEHDPTITHESFCAAVSGQYKEKWAGREINE